ncbi:endonuclease III [Opitutia bacterium KCR 482]|nr:endonuclease III [Opitutae bacterium KCR 482]MDF3287154.1 endonuclease III [Opitutae bacterium KCR 482]
MTKSQKAKTVSERLDALYPRPAIPLNHGDSFTFLVAVMLSAQCTDKRVNETTPALFARADSPQKMASLSEDEIREIIKPCGLAPTKAKNIKKMSEILCEKFGGRVPNTFEELESLPGVGHKTASVLMSQAFGVPAFPVDTHIHRLATRWGLTDGKSVEHTERDLKKIFPKEKWHDLHLQFIYYGREHCKASACKTPDKYCQLCKLLRK